MDPSEIYVPPSVPKWDNMIQHGFLSPCTPTSHPLPLIPPSLGPNMTLLACIWVPWVSFPPLLTANFNFIDVSLFAGIRKHPWSRPSHSPHPLFSCLPPPLLVGL